eukprot:1145590-Pelagomonas_calceolata.AAC.4
MMKKTSFSEAEVSAYSTRGLCKETMALYRSVMAATSRRSSTVDTICSTKRKGGTTNADDIWIKKPSLWAA